MKSLVIIQEKKAVTTSLKVAEVFGKNHQHVLRDIQSLECSDKFRASNFGLSSYKSSQNKELPMYEITRQGFTILAMGYTGKKAMEFKEAYIEAFDLMEEELRNLAVKDNLLDKKREKYKKQGYSDIWIEKRIKSLEVREELTEEWKERGVTESKQFSTLTSIINKETFGLSPTQHKNIKGLKSQDLRDHMTNTELAFSILAEVSTLNITQTEDAQGFDENKEAAQKGGKIAGDARKALEAQTGKQVVSNLNFLPENRKNYLK